MEFCDPYEACTNLDGRLLLNRTLTGPSLASVGSELGLKLSSAKVPNVRALPFAKAIFQQTWRAKDACIGPARTILGLAPAEELVFEERTVRQFDFSSVITRNQEFSSTFGTETRTESEDIQTSVDTTSTSTTDTDTVDLGPLGTWGSGGDADVKTIEEVVERTTRKLTEVLTSVSATQVNGLGSEISTSTSITSESSLSRRIINPMRDRTMELRFHPVFRTFEVETSFLNWVFGMILRPAIELDRDFVVANPNFIQRVIPVTRLAPETQLIEPGPLPMQPIYARLAQDETHAIVADLKSAERRNTRKFMVHTRNVEGLSGFRRLATSALSSPEMRPAAAKDMPVEGAFALDQLQVTGNDVELPARSAELFKTAVKLPKWQVSLLDQLSLPDILDRFRRTFSTKTEVRMFIGTHLEAVPGRCVLPLTHPLVEP